MFRWHAAHVRSGGWGEWAYACILVGVYRSECVTQRVLGISRLTHVLPASSTQGLIYMTIGVIMLSPDSLLVRLADRTASPYTLVLWRQVFVAATQIPASIMYCGGWRKTIAQVKKSGVYFWASIPVQAAGAICIALAFTMTSAANALVLFYLQPLWAAIGSVLYFKDTLPKRTIFAIVVGIAAAVAVFFGARSKGDDDGGKASTIGDILALVGGVAYATYFMICRACALSAGPSVEMLPASAAGMALSVFVSLILAKDELVAIEDDVFWLWVAINGVIVIGISVMWMTVAMKYILPPESALIGLLELALGPIWVFAGIGEVPSVLTIVAAIALLVTLAGHEYLGLMESKKKNQSKMAPILATSKDDLEALINADPAEERDDSST